MELLTPRLRLREFRTEDFATTHAYGSDLEVTRHTLFGPNTDADTRGFIAAMVAAQAAVPRVDYTFAIELKDGGAHAGAIGFTVDKAEATLGYVLHKPYWGQGYMTEAARAMISFAFGELKLHRVYATCDVANPASFRVMEKVGMRREGLSLKSSWMKNRWRDTLHYAILASEWPAQS